MKPKPTFLPLPLLLLFCAFRPAVAELPAAGALYDASRAPALCFWCSSDWSAVDSLLKQRGVDDARARGRIVDVLRQREPEFAAARKEFDSAQAALDAMHDSLSRSGLHGDQLRFLAPAAFAELDRAHRKAAELEERLRRLGETILEELRRVSLESAP